MRKNCFSRHRCYLWKTRGFNITCVLDWLKKIYQPLRSESVCLLFPVEKQLLSYHSFWYPSAFVALPREEAERASLCSCQSSNSFSVAHWKQDKQVSCRLYTSFKSTKFPYRSPSRIWLLLMTWAFTVKGISYKSSFSIIKPFLCNLKGKENQNKKISDFEYLNYFEYVSHCVISTALLYFLPDFKAEKKVQFWALERGGCSTSYLGFMSTFYLRNMMTTNRDGESLGIVSEVFFIRNKIKKHPTSKSEEIVNETLWKVLKKLSLALSMN